MSISIPTWSQIYCTPLSWKSSFSVLFQPSTNFNQTQSTTGAKTGAGGCPHTTELVQLLCLQLCCDKLPLFNSLFTKSPFQKLSPSYNPAHTRVIPLSKLLPFNIRVWCVIRYEHWTSLGQKEKKGEGTIGKVNMMRDPFQVFQPISNNMPVPQNWCSDPLQVN